MIENILKGVDKESLLQSIINPLGQLDLSKEELKLLFFRHVGAEYAMAARKNRVPYAQNIARAGQTFSGIGGGTDPMMMLMLMGGLGGEGKQNVKQPELPPEDPQLVMSQLTDILTGLCVQVDAIADKVARL